MIGWMITAKKAVNTATMAMKNMARMNLFKKGLK